MASLLRSESPRSSFHRPGGAGAEPPLFRPAPRESRLARLTQDRRSRLSLSIGYPPFSWSFRIRWARDSRVRSDVALGYTSRQQNAHVTESRVVLYRWHPWHGRSAFIFGAVTKGEQAVFRCALEPANVARPLEVPQWMFDAAACCRVVLAATPSVSVDVLRELDQLISAVKPAEPAAVLQAEHLSLRDSGGACATRKRSTIARSAGAVSSTAVNAAVAEPSGRGSRTDAEVAGAASPGTSPPSALRASPRTGGGR